MADLQYRNMSFISSENIINNRDERCPLCGPQKDTLIFDGIMFHILTC